MCAHHTICFFDSLLETLLDRQHTYLQRIQSSCCRDCIHDCRNRGECVMKGLDYYNLSKLWEETRYCERGECHERTGLQYWKVNLVD